MLNRILILAIALQLLAGCSTPVQPATEALPTRTMGVTKGPELVFLQPVEAVLPLLAGATATGQNGRVGGELVFWSYRLADGRDVLLHACAELEGVDCAGRARLICAAGEPRPLQTQALSGEVRRLQCSAVGQAAPGELRPGCSDTEFSSPLVVGVSSCP